MHSPLAPYPSQCIIAGPCSAESEEQILFMGQHLKADGRVHIFRAGVWKPRTRPGSFEGVGAIALPWLQNMTRETGLPVAIEIANPYQIQEALKYDIQYLWIGARTTANPFSVQEIADALKGVQKPILIKNPTNADVDLWTGAVERIAQSGIENIALIHRGFTKYGHSKYRNEPRWQIALEMRRRFKQLPIFCDPSHICGNRILLQGVAQKAADLDYNGLMIESHPSPDTAWTDPAQQVTPAELSALLDKIIWRSKEVASISSDNTLEMLRGKIDDLDEELLQLLGKRMSLADEIGAYKREANITILQVERWNYILERAREKMEALGLGESFIQAYFDAIHLESIRHQTNMMNRNISPENFM